MQMKSLDQVITHLAKTAPSRKERRALYSAVIQQGTAGEALTQEQTPRLRGIEVKKSASRSVEVTFTIRFVPSASEPGQGPTGWPVPLQPELAVLLGGLSADEVRTMRALEPEILKWIAASDDNAARFYADPLGALERAGIAIQPLLRKKIQHVRDRSASLQSPLPPVRITSIKVGV